MAKKYLPYVALALAAVFAFFALRSCGGPDEKYWVKKATYDQLAKDAAAQLAKALEVNTLQEKIIVVKDVEIAEKQAIVTRYAGKVSTLTAELTALQDAEPVQPEIEAQPLVINLRAQIGNLAQMLSMSTDIINAKDGIIADWSAKFNAQTVIAENWKRAYETEHRLRLLSEDLNKSLEHQGKVSRLYGRVSMAGLAAAGAYILITSLTK